MSSVDVVAFSSAEAGRVLGVSGATIIRWLDDGSLEESFAVRSSGRYVTAASVLACKAQREAHRHALTTTRGDN